MRNIFVKCKRCHNPEGHDPHSAFKNLSNEILRLLYNTFKTTISHSVSRVCISNSYKISAQIFGFPIFFKCIFSVQIWTLSGTDQRTICLETMK
jgi:hypothetical protein